MPDESFNIETSDYKGPNRREHCDCHIKHDKILQDHTDEIKELKRDSKERDYSRTTEHGNMWEGIKAKVEKKLFYVFVLITVGILGVTYKGIHDLALDIKDVERQVAVVNTNVQAHFTQNTDIKKAIEKVESKIEKTNARIENHILDTQFNHNHKKE